MHPILEHCESSRAWLLDAVEALVAAESPTSDKQAVDRCGDEVARRLESVGARVTRLAQRERGDHLRAEIAGDGRPVMLLGHIDTVWPIGQLGVMPFGVRDGRLHGPGIFDMKGGIAAALLAIRALRGLAIPHPPLLVLLTTDEEVGSQTSRATIEQEARRCRAVLVLEPPLPGGHAKTSRKGAGDFELIVHGVSAHAGIAPDAGANAVHELAHQILAVQSLVDAPSRARGLSANVTVASGGERSNVIPDRARAVVDARVPTMADAGRLEAALRSLTPRMAGTRLEVRGGINRPPMERTAGTAALFAVARQCAADLGKTLDEGATGGGSDGNFTSAAGVPTLDGLGPDGDGAHALHEHVVLADFAWRAAFLGHLIASLRALPDEVHSTHG